MEEWKDIKGYEGSYQISNLGRVKSLSRIIIRSNGNPTTIKAKIKKTPIRNDGYFIVNLCMNNGSNVNLIHRLIAEAFIDNPNNYPLVRHLNDIKTDNRLDNLCWGTYCDNMVDSIKNDKYVKPNVTLTSEQVKEIKSLLKEGLTYNEISNRFPVCKGTIGDIKRSKTWKDCI